MNNQSSKKKPVKTIIDFFKSLKGKRPPATDADFSTYNQSEAEYQEEQARWLESIKRKKND